MSNSSHREIALVLVLAASLPLGFYWLTGSIGIDIFDEGYLWYGVIRTGAGDIPLRDFQAYDPGRYYWSAAWSRLLGDGILALRLSATFFQILGLTCGLLAARRFTRNPGELLLVALLLLLWSYPRHKIFDPSLAMINVYVATRILEAPGPRTLLLAGLTLGLSATFGRNHALYCALGQLGTLMLVLLRDRPSRPFHGLLLWVGGAVLGYAPVLGLFLFASGYFEAFLQSLLQFSTMHRPVPWPWRVAALPYVSLEQFVTNWSVSLTYVALALGYPSVLLIAVRRRGEPLNGQHLLYACAFVGAAYSHHAFGRASMSHLAQAVHPFLLGAMCLPTALRWPGRSRRLLWAGVVILTVIQTGQLHRNSLEALVGGGRDDDRFVTTIVRGDVLRLSKQKADDLRDVQMLVRAYVPEEEPLLVLPYRALYYPLLDRQAPTWGIYFLRAGQGESDAEIIRKLEEQGVDWILYSGEKLSGVPLFSEIRPDVVTYLQTRFLPVEDRLLAPPHMLLRRRR